MPRFSFVVIAYNVERYIEKCVASIKSQTFSDFEAIIVDDCSTDATASIVDNAIAGDSRFSLVRRRANAGAHIARKTGADRTHGRYLFFIDGDDCVRPDLCERLDKEFQRDDVDILRFGLEVSSTDAPLDFRRALEDSFNLDTGLRRGHEILQSIFSETFSQRGNWSVEDCCFEGDFARESFAMMTEQPLGRMEDAYEFFVLADRARSMRVINDYRGLLYSYGAGDSGNGNQTREKFEKGQRGIHDSLQALMDYSASHDDEIHRECSAWMRRTTLGIVGRDWSGRMPMEDQIHSFPALRDTWQPSEVAYIVSEPLYARAVFVWQAGGYPDYQDPLVQWAQLLMSVPRQDDRDERVTAKVRMCRELCSAIEHREDSRMQANFLAWARTHEIDRQNDVRTRIERARATEVQAVEEYEASKAGVVRAIGHRMLPAGTRRREVVRALAHRSLHWS